MTPRATGQVLGALGVCVTHRLHSVRRQIRGTGRRKDGGGRTTKEAKTMSSRHSRRMKIGDFLLRRLEEAGVRHLFGVPGDYNLELLQQLQDTGALKWIGTCSELNASYAADGCCGQCAEQGAD